MELSGIEKMELIPYLALISDNSQTMGRQLFIFCINLISYNN